MRGIRRIERPPLVIYLERDLFGSFLCLWMLALLLPVAWAAWGTPLIGGAIAMAAVGTGVGAFLLLFRARVFAVDRDVGELRILERVVPWRTRRTQIPLDQVELWMWKPPEDPRQICFLLIGRRQSTPFVVGKSREPEPLRRLAERMAVDLGRPLSLAIPES